MSVRYFRILWFHKVGCHWGQAIGGNPVYIVDGRHAMVMSEWEIGEELDPLEVMSRDRSKRGWTMQEIHEQISRRLTKARTPEDALAEWVRPLRAGGGR